MFLKIQISDKRMLNTGYISVHNSVCVSPMKMIRRCLFLEDFWISIKLNASFAVLMLSVNNKYYHPLSAYI